VDTRVHRGAAARPRPLRGREAELCPENGTMLMTDPEMPDTARLLGMSAHPEGGWYKETWRSDTEMHPEGYPGRRSVCSAIYFLLPPDEESRWHTVRSPELWLWHRGGPLLLLLGGSGERPNKDPMRILLGPDIAGGQRPQALVPAGHWQAARPAGDEEVLVSCVVAPGFDFDDFQLLPNN